MSEILKEMTCVPPAVRSRAARAGARRLGLVLAAALALTLAGPGASPAQDVPDPDPAATAPAAEPGVTEPVAGAEPAQADEGTETAAPSGSDAPAEPPARTAAAESVDRAVADPVGTAAAGVDRVREGSASFWNDTLVPMYQRFVLFVPSLVKALGILILFWLAAIILGWLVTYLLKKIDWDNRMVEEWGLEKLFRSADGERDVEQTFGKAVKWIVLLFGIVAFFDALNLAMVAEPLQNVLDKLLAVVPALLKALAILVVYWILATVVRIASTRGLQAVGFDTRAARYIPAREVKGEVLGPSSMVGRLLFYVILLFAIPPFLDALGQESLVTPLRDMLGKVLAFVPNIIAAVILLFIGRIVATIVREVVTNFLAAAGLDAFAARFGFGDAEPVVASDQAEVAEEAEKSSTGFKRLSEIIGAVAYFFIIIPIAVAAVDALEIDALSAPVTATLERLLAAIPLIFVAVIIIFLGYYIAKAVRSLVESFLSSVGFDSVPEKLGLAFLRTKEGTSLSSIAATVVMVVILLLTAEQALATLGLEELAVMVGALIAYLPRLAVGLAIIVAALALGNYVASLVASVLSGSEGRLASTIAKWAIIFLGFSMGLNQLGVAESIINVAVSAVLGAAALALGLAFGLGGRDRAREVIEKTAPAGASSRPAPPSEAAQT